MPHMEWKKYFANHISGKQLLFKIYERLLQLNNKKAKNPTESWTKTLNRHFSKKGI
jgi:hypothetical protein